MVMVYVLVYAMSLIPGLLRLRFFQQQMGFERHKRTTLFSLRPVDHCRHPFLSRAYL